MAIRTWPAIVLLLLLAAPAAAQSPIVYQLEPYESPTVGGLRLTIMGANFGAAGGVVDIQGRSIAVPAGPDWAADRVVVTVPPGDPRYAPLEVVPAGGQASTPVQFWYQPAMLEAISPNPSPSAGGVVITLTGSNFGTPGAEGMIHLGGQTLYTTPVSHEELHLVTPKLPPGTSWPLQLYINGYSAGDPQTYVVQSPSILDVQPRSAPTTGGFIITITGENFGESSHPAPVVRFGGVASPSAFRTDQQHVLCDVPDGSGTGKTLYVSIGSAESAPSPVLFSYLPPELNLIDPPNGPAAGGVRVTLHGENFGPPGTARTLTLERVFGGPVVHGVINGPQTHFRLEADLPAMQSGIYFATLEVDGQFSQQFQYEALGGVPAVSGLSNPSGPTEGGTRITIYGSDFGPGAGVARIGPWPCSIVTWGETAIDCVVPEAWSGSFEVTVERSDGESGGGASYLYDPAYIIQPSPLPMAAAGGTLLTIVGQNFGIQGAPRQVTINGQIAPEQQWYSHQEIVVQVPPGPANTSVPLCIGILGKPGDCVEVPYGEAIGVEPPRLPTAFGLRLAGANPSRAVTNFAVDLPRDARYALAVFNSAGRLVHRVEAEGTAGTQVVRWDGAGATGGGRVPAGLYWARLEVAGQRFVRKVLRL